MVNERVVKRLVRRIKEYSGDLFKCLPISDTIRNLELNPYIPATQLREPRDTLKKLKRKLSEQQQISRGKGEVPFIEIVEDPTNVDYVLDRKISEDLTIKSGRKLSDQTSSVYKEQQRHEREMLHEQLFHHWFKRILVSECNFVLDCISSQTDCWNYIEVE